jgi:hypothetical protein
VVVINKNVQVVIVQGVVRDNVHTIHYVNVGKIVKFE